MIPYEPFDFYIKRKLYVHNMGHATCAYLGDLLGYEYIWQSIAVPEVRLLVHNAMLESAMALSKKYGASLGDLQLHIADLLHRFTNMALKDTCQRVGGDPGRKLSPEDRLIGSAKLALEQGITPAYIAVGAAAGLKRYLAEAEDKTLTPEGVLETVSGLNRDEQLAKMILENYDRIIEGATIAQLLQCADEQKHRNQQNVI